MSAARCVLCGHPETCAAGEHSLCYPHFSQLWLWLDEKKVPREWDATKSAMGVWVNEMLRRRKTG